MNISFEIQGEEVAIRKLETIADGLDFQKSGVWKEVQTEFFQIENEIFQSEGGKSKSGAWKPLKPSYKAIKLKEYGDLPINQRTRELYKSLTGETGNTVFEQSADEAIFGSLIPYGKFVQKNRPVLDFTDEQIDQLLKPIQKHLIDLVEK